MTVEIFNQSFESIAGPLRSYLLRVTASVADAEDIVHDTYLKALNKLDTFRGESSVKTWVFSIANNVAKDNRRAAQRWTENINDMARSSALADAGFMSEAMHIRTHSPQGQFEAKEHIAFCFTCIAKSLPLEQQLCLLLKDVYGFKIAEIAEIIDNNESMVKYFLHASREKMMHIFDGRCSLINKEGVCHQCSELNGIYNPKQNTQEELMKLDLVREASSGNKEHLFELRIEILKDVDPFTSPAAELQLHHLEYNRKLMEK